MELSKPIFVFGSNMAGRHGAGAALFALKNHGAVYGIGRGLQGNSYAIPTKDENIETLPLYEIAEEINWFRLYVETYADPEQTFYVTPVGCGLAGYKPRDIAPLFTWALDKPNIELPEEFLEELLQ